MGTSASSAQASATTFGGGGGGGGGVATLPDDFWVEWNPVQSPLVDVGEIGWIRITNGIRELACSHGFERDMDRVETGTAVIVFDNRNRSLDPSNPYAVNVGGFTPLRHVRIRASAGGTTYTIWRGFTVDWRPDWSIDDAWVTLTAKDALVAAAKKLRENTLTSAIAATAPNIWLPLDDGGTALAQGRDVAGQDAAMAGTSATGNILPFGDQPTTTFPHPGLSKGDVVTTVPGFQVNPAGFTVIAVFAATQDQPQVIFAAGPQPPPTLLSGDVGLVVDAGDTYSLRVGNPSGNSLLQFDRPRADPSTIVMGRYNPTDTTLWASQGWGSIGGNTVANSLLGGTYAPRAGLVRVGAGLDTPNEFPFLGSLSHVALWQRQLSDAEARTIFSGYWGLPHNAFAAPVRSANVVGWVLDRLGVPAGRRDLSVGTLNMGGTDTDLTALEMMSRAAATEGGYFFANREGKYVLRLRGAVGSHRGTYDTRPSAGGGVNAAAADLTLAHDDRTFATVARMQVTTAAEPQVVEYRHPNADSSTGFGEVLYDPPTQFRHRDDAAAAAVLAVGDGTPHLAVVEVEVLMGAHNVDRANLLASDILDQVGTVARIPGAVGPGPALLPHEQTGKIVKVDHAYHRDHTWRTKWALIPD